MIRICSSGICKECGEQSYRAREDFFMVNDDLWNKFWEHSGHVCWSCLVKKLKSELDRKPQASDFSQYRYFPYNLGNPEVEKLTGIKVKNVIQVQVRRVGGEIGLGGSVTDVSTLDKMEEIHPGTAGYREFIKDKLGDSPVTKESLMELQNAWAKEMKKKYPDSIVNVQDDQNVRLALHTVIRKLAYSMGI